MFLIQWGIDGRYSSRRVSSSPPPTFSTRLLESSKQRGRRHVLGNLTDIAKLCWRPRDPEINEFEVNCCVHEAEDHWAQFKLQTEPEISIHSQLEPYIMKRRVWKGGIIDADIRDPRHWGDLLTTQNERISISTASCNAEKYHRKTDRLPALKCEILYKLPFESF